MQQEHGHDHVVTESHEVHDPVCGMTISSEDAAGTYAYRGETYYFCNPGCLKKFKADPEHYLHPEQQTAPHTGAEGAVYICPMDLEVRKMGPGTCPKCGMALEPETIAALPVRTEYTCPMHPEIIRSEPGACPICGMALEPREVTGEEVNHELIDMTRRFWISVVLTAPMLLLMVSEMLPGKPLQMLLGPKALLGVQFALATPVVLWGGWPFFVRGWLSVVNRDLNMPRCGSVQWRREKSRGAQPAEYCRIAYQAGVCNRTLLFPHTNRRMAAGQKQNARRREPGVSN